MIHWFMTLWLIQKFTFDHIILPKFNGTALLGVVFSNVHIRDFKNLIIFVS